MAEIPEPGLEAGREALRRFLAGADDLDTMLTNIVSIANDTVPGSDLASITLMVDGTPRTPVCTEQAALELDETQYSAGDGPCLAAIRHGGVERYTVAEPRWPAFGAAATERGVLSTL